TRPQPPLSTLFPYTTLFRSYYAVSDTLSVFNQTPTHNKGDNFYNSPPGGQVTDTKGGYTVTVTAPTGFNNKQVQVDVSTQASARSEEHTSELQSRENLVCRL